MNEQNIFKNDNVTSNSAQLEILKKNFPNCFDKDGHFILDSFKEVIKENDLDFSEESYSLNWLGKSYAQLLRNEKAHTFIQPNLDHNNQEINKNSQNLLIKGDNLEVLKHLRNAYSEKIKMIYIDPPYNTGSDGFIYQDDRKFSKEELMHLAKVSEDEAKRILDFTAKGSNSHSAWLTFIYPRLYIARELLREDGVIFISIDDNEQSQLKLLCDEIFGEENFIASLSVQLNPRGRGLDRFIARTHEYVLVYVKNSELPTSISGLEKEGSMIAEYDRNDAKGAYRLIGLRNRNQSFNPETRPNLYYPIFVSETGSVSLTQTHEYKYQVYPDAPNGIKTCWTWGQDKFKNEQELLIAEKTSNEWRVFRKDYLMKTGEIATSLAKSLWLDKDINNDYGKKSIKELFNKNVMSFPKSPYLIKKLLRIGADKDSYILDFFAGSGTTAHAMMDLNAEDNGNRQFILVQLPEETDKKSEAYKASYETIFDITKARLEKASEKIKQDNPEYEGDLGFKIFETAPLPDNYNNEVLELNAESQLEMFDGAKNDEQLLNAILTTWTLYDRIPLTDPINEFLIDDYKAQYSYEYNTLYLMQPNFTTQNIKTLINKIETDPQFIPEKIVIYGFNFDSKIQRELDEALKSYQNKKSLNIDLLVRYY